MRLIPTSISVILILFAAVLSAAPRTEDLSLSNELCSFGFDPVSGRLTDIRLTDSTAALTIDATAASPVFLWVDVDGGESERRVVLNQRQVLSRHVFKESPGYRQLELLWDDLADDTGQPAGIALELRYRLDESSTFARVHTRVTNRGTRQMRGLFLGLEGLQLAEDPKTETFAGAAGHAYLVKPSPREVFEGKGRSFGGMYCSWFDYSTPEWGFGTGYLNRKSMDMVSKIVPDATASLSFGWQLFRLEEAFVFMNELRPPPKVYPLRPGEDFTSDEWFLGLHRHGWQTTALYYRERYEEVFAGDYLPWSEVSPAVRNADLLITLSCAWGKMGADGKKHDLSQGELRVPFSDVPAHAERMLAETGARPENVLMALIGQATHWGIYKLPDYFPPCEKAGGEDGFREMVGALRDRVGLAGSHYYIHTGFNHPEADHYVRAADTGWSANLYANYDHLGRIACKASPDWFSLWKDQVFPEFVRFGATGLEVDEGSGHHFICGQPGHGHGLDSVSVLTAQWNGDLRIHREWHAQAGPLSYLECEGGGDVGARLFDLWETGAPGPMSVIRYTHPDKMISCWPKDGWDILEALVYGMPVFYHKDWTLHPEYLTFVRIRRQLREQEAPGYPQGYRETDGLQAVPDELMAKVYTGDEGITVVYAALDDTAGEIVIDPAALGFGGPVRRHSLPPISRHEGGFWILRRTDLSE